MHAQRMSTQDRCVGGYLGTPRFQGGTSGTPWLADQPPVAAAAAAAAAAGRRRRAAEQANLGPQKVGRTRPTSAQFSGPPERTHLFSSVRLPSPPVPGGLQWRCSLPVLGAPLWGSFRARRAAAGAGAAARPARRQVSHPVLKTKPKTSYMCAKIKFTDIR